MNRRFAPKLFHGIAALALMSAFTTGCERTELLGVVPSAGGADGDDPLVPDRPRVVPVLNDVDARDTDPTFTEDQTELYFMSDRTGDKRIWRSLRPTADDPWGTPELVPELNTAGENENPFVSNDGLTIWFFTDRDRTISAQWRSTRATRDDPWGMPAPVEGLVFGVESSDVAVTVDPGETLFILNSKPSGSGPYGLYRLERATASDPLGPPVLMDEVVSDRSEYDPDLRRDGLFLAFDSARVEPRQIYWTRRNDRNSPFDAPVLVPALAGQSNDEAAAFSENLRYVMFSSNRTGNVEIYEALLSTPLF